MNRLHKPALMYALLGLALACSPLVAAYAWVDIATISSTVGNTNGRLCTGLGRADIACPSYAPVVVTSGTSGFVGIGTNQPTAPLSVETSTTDPIFVLNRQSQASISYRIVNNHVQKDIFSNTGVRKSFFIFDTSNGNIGINTFKTSTTISYNPSTTLHLGGTLRLSNGGEACDANRLGAIRYTSGDFQFCRNGTAWEPLASIADSAAPDRIISGTTTMAVVNNTGFISITQAGTNTGWFDPQRGLVTLGVSTTGSVSSTRVYARQVQVGDGGDQKGLLHVRENTRDLVIDLTAAPNMFRILAGTGDFSGILLAASDVSNQLVLNPSGNVGIGTVSPLAQLDVSGSLKIAGSGSEVCGPGTYGTMRRNPTTGRLQICTEAE